MNNDSFLDSFIETLLKLMIPMFILILLFSIIISFMPNYHESVGYTTGVIIKVESYGNNGTYMMIEPGYSTDYASGYEVFKISGRDQLSKAKYFLENSQNIVVFFHKNKFCFNLVNKQCAFADDIIKTKFL